MSLPARLAEQLEHLIGFETRYEGHNCRIHELLDDGQTLILIAMEQNAIQGDQHGNPRRRVPLTFSIPVLDEDGKSLHPDCAALNLPVEW